MKTTIRILEIAACILFLCLTGCSDEQVEGSTPEPPGVPEINSFSIDMIGWNYVSLRGLVSGIGENHVTEIGFVWSTSPNPTVALSTKVFEDLGPGNLTSIEFARNANGLSPDTKYYARAYATNSEGTGYSTEIDFVTLPPGAPQGIYTYSANRISSSSAVGSGQVDSDHGGPITAIGTVWSTSHSPDVSLSTKTVDSTAVGAFKSNLAGLAPGTTYYVMAYATNSFGTTYGEELSFVTPAANMLTVTTNDIKVVVTSVGPFPWDPPGSPGSYFYAVSGAGGNIPDDGGDLVVERGLEWRYERDSFAFVGRTSDGAGAGEFTSSLASLLETERSYYVRAYATNASGTAYGQNEYVYIPKN